MVFEKIKSMLSEQLGISADTITMESNIISDLGADSLDIVEMIMALEETYNLQVPDTGFDCTCRTENCKVKFSTDPFSDCIEIKCRKRPEDICACKPKPRCHCEKKPPFFPF